MTKLRAMFAKLSLYENGSLLAELQVKLILLYEIRLKQLSDLSIAPHVKLIEKGKTLDFKINSKRVLCSRDRDSPSYLKHIVALMLCFL
ncbi:Integrase, catalytic core [Gossypium australe]|uniref:Integrase, catalytic core n=1 Tax=Gossypium australe TaxID=47621 RepID=A0A5B6VW74_9ROSI|nr:Integrase, catalytic core [Gossypium australe]